MCIYEEPNFIINGAEIMQTGKFNVVTDGSWGSCGKGLITTALAAKYRPEFISTTNMANAGHTAVWHDGQKFIAKALPSATALAKWTKGEYNPIIIVGSSAAFHIDQLLKEIVETEVKFLFIHPRAGVITEEHKIAEQSLLTGTKHVASTMQGCGAFLSDKIMRRKELKLAQDYDTLKQYMTPMMPNALDLDNLRGQATPLIFKAMLNSGKTFLHEGSQGFSLDIHHGSHYPQCTSRSTTAVQNMSDMGFSAQDMGDVYLVIRPYPIRVGNVIEDGKTVGYSGDCYYDQVETSWEEVVRQAGAPPEAAKEVLDKELTTVTKRLRRVFTFSETQLKEAVAVNGATKIALNFANYVDWSCTGCNEYSALSPKIHDFIAKVEDIAGIPVTIVGTGPQNDHVCFRQVSSGEFIIKAGTMIKRNGIPAVVQNDVIARTNPSNIPHFFENR